jgi:hypothetical protein
MLSADVHDDLFVPNADAGSLALTAGVVTRLSTCKFLLMRLEV